MRAPGTARDAARIAPLLLVLTASTAAEAQDRPALPSPLRPEVAARIAVARRAELRGARRSIDAGRARVRRAGTLDDPVVTASVDHLPVALHGVDLSATVEQTFPLSRVLARRERLAAEEVGRARAAARVTRLDVGLDAEMAALDVYMAREMRTIMVEMRAVAARVSEAARARYGAGLGEQAEVLRADTEVSRLAAEVEALGLEIAAAEVMLRAALELPPATPVPEIELALDEGPGATVAEVRRGATRRPELAVARAEIRRAAAEVDVMRSMDAPMLMVRVGGAYTMADGPGVMLMAGLSLPIWRGARRASVEEASAMVAMARDELSVMERMTAAEALVARARLVAQRTRLRALRAEVLPRARRTVEAALSAYVAGRAATGGGMSSSGGLSPVLESVSMLWDTRARIVSAEVAVGAARARLRRAMGGDAAWAATARPIRREGEPTTAGRPAATPALATRARR